MKHDHFEMEKDAVLGYDAKMAGFYLLIANFTQRSLRKLT